MALGKEKSKAEQKKMITIVQDTWLKPGTEEEGLQLMTRYLWSDVQSFEGFVSFSYHLFTNEDAPGHIIAFAT
ncbi:hypothetical protein MPNT_100078 [Candidatus Methylacidithermus pantelleriae]|uniref:Uncharacterized protein n=2 Tax=Candidatus Methylacidithermus pantelleriae TaxID=2744239 RepID=A0A8J2BGI9_9BACT|nr:hypothetical protein MPNT_100078 [Candidatus Methylacidithermus pantelleriae]